MKRMDLWHYPCLGSQYVLRPFYIHLRNFQFLQCLHLTLNKTDLTLLNNRSQYEHQGGKPQQAEISKSHHGGKPQQSKTSGISYKLNSAIKLSSSSKLLATPKHNAAK